MGNCVKIAGDRGKIEIEVLAYERPSAANVEDANWLASILSVEVVPFSGSFGIGLTTHELARLHEQLRKSLDSFSGTVSLRSVEDNLRLDIKLNKHGGGSVAGSAHPTGWPRTELHFEFETDQTYLHRIARELAALLRQFPVKDF